MKVYFISFTASFFATVGIILFILWLCSKFDFLKNFKKDRGNGSKKKICRIGGVAIILGFLLTLFFINELTISQKLWGIISASVVILFFGIYDDFYELDWKTQLLFQVSVAMLVFILGVRVEFITNPLGGFVFLNVGRYLIPSLAFVILWLVLMINSINWTDGIDGLSGGISLIGALTIFFLSLKPEVNQPPVGIITMALSGALTGFLIFNLNPSKILAGTSGSMFMGFVLGSLAIFAGTKIATALLVMAVPIIDAIWVIGERFREGESIFKSDKRHLHHKLSEIGWSSRKITFFFWGITLCISLIALNTRAIGKIVTLFLVSLVMISVLIFINNKIRKQKLNEKN